MVPDANVCSPDELVAAVRAGDLDVLDRITRCFGERLVREGRRRCRTPEDAEDAVQDALLSAGRHLDQFRGEGSLEGWLVRMVANACHRMQRGRKNDPTLHVFDAVLASDDASPERRAAQAELLQTLGGVLDELTPVDRAVFVLAEGEDWTGPEIAERLDLTAQAVRSRLTRARRKVRDRLAERLTPQPS